MMFRLLLFILLVFNNTSYAQGFLANGSFEDRNTCTEFHALCAPEAWFFIPAYVKSSYKEDNNHVEVLLRGSSVMATNFIYTKLLCPLQYGQQYTFSMWVRSNVAFDSLNVWLGSFEPGINSVEIDQPTLTITTEHADSSKAKWRKYVYRYTAAGDERFLMIGNMNVYQPPRRMNSAARTPVKDPFYYIDNISLFDTNDPGKKCREYVAINKQLYNQNRRHPASLIETVAIDKSLITEEDKSKKTVSWVIVDTPPANHVVIDTLIIPDILFKFNSSEINKIFTGKLDSLLNTINGKIYKEIEVVGHTDNEGTEAYNQKLSLDRANTIKNHIESKKLGGEKTISAKGEGEHKPRASNQTSIGRQQNRRVEIILK